MDTYQEDFRDGRHDVETHPQCDNDVWRSGIAEELEQVLGELRSDEVLDDVDLSEMASSLAYEAGRLATMAARARVEAAA